MPNFFFNFNLAFIQLFGVFSLKLVTRNHTDDAGRKKENKTISSRSSLGALIREMMLEKATNLRAIFLRVFQFFELFLAFLFLAFNREINWIATFSFICLYLLPSVVFIFSFDGSVRFGERSVFAIFFFNFVFISSSHIIGGT